jgi:mRNA-degrading endonuclease RelE of RelBE toxin-antitoxin system
MTTILADSLLDSLGGLSPAEHRQANAAIRELRNNPNQPGLQVHRVDDAVSRNIWSARVNRDVRIIFQRDGDMVLIAYVGHHDAAYDWARRRRIGPNP